MDHKTKEELCDFYQRLFNTDETFAREEASLENDLEVLQAELAHVRATREEATKLMRQLNLLLEGTNDLEVLQAQLADVRATREEATKLMRQLNLLLEGTKVDPPKTAHP